MAQWEHARLFDQRTVQRHIRAGMTSDDDYERHLSELPDVSAKIRPKDEGGDNDGFDAPVDDDFGDMEEALTTEAPLPPEPEEPTAPAPAPTPMGRPDPAPVAPPPADKWSGPDLGNPAAPRAAPVVPVVPHPAAPHLMAPRPVTPRPVTPPPMTPPPVVPPPPVAAPRVPGAAAPRVGPPLVPPPVIAPPAPPLRP